jgi:hypothetical protein
LKRIQALNNTCSLLQSRNLIYNQSVVYTDCLLWCEVALQSFLAGSDKTALAQIDIDLVIRELGGGRSREDVCRMLCVQRGYECGNAQDVVVQVSARERTRIARRQAPFLLLLGSITLLGGILLLIGTIYSLLHYDHIHPGRSMRYLVTGFGLGVAMTLGSAIGLVQAVIAMWK